MRKKILCLVLTSIVILTGCSKEEKYVDLATESLKNFEKITNGEMLVGTSYTIGINNEDLENNVSLSMKISLKQYNEQKAKMTTDVSIMGIEKSIESYLFEENGKIYYAMPSDENFEGTKWNRSLSTDEQFSFQNFDIVSSIKDNKTSKIGTEKIGENDYLLYSSEVDFLELLRIMNVFSLAENNITDEEKALFKDISASSVKMYIDENKKQIKKLEIDMSKAVDDLLKIVLSTDFNSNNSFIKQFEEYKTFGENIDISINKFIFYIDVQLGSIGNVNDFDIPEEVLNSEIIEYSAE